MLGKEDEKAGLSSKRSDVKSEIDRVVEDANQTFRYGFIVDL